jgi:purine nucleosidase
MKSPINLIIDTDIGDDIDDALAIAFALNSPELKLLGVTTVYGNTMVRAKIAKCLLNTAGFEHIQVFAGCDQPLKGSERLDSMKTPCQYIEKEMGHLPVNPAHAVDYIIEVAMNSDQPLTLLAIGPLTNVAVALLKEPRLKEKLERIVIMGGAYYFHFVEWNIWLDPEAAHVVFQSGVPLTAVGLDVTKRCLMNDDQLSRLQRNTELPLPKLLWQLIRQWQNVTNRTYPILHDALAVYSVFGTELLKLEQEAVAVELTGTHTRGMTLNRTDRDREEQLVQSAKEEADQSIVRVAKQVEYFQFIELFLDRVHTAQNCRI